MAEASTAVTVISVRLEQRVYPPYDPYHGTNWSMVWRQVTITTESGDAIFEQTDYGHPGRMNAWEHRAIAAALQSRAVQLQAVAEAVGALAG